MQIAILGAGYVGAALAEHLVAEGHRVTVIGRRLEPLRALASRLGESVEARAAATTDSEALKAALEGAERVVHLAPPPKEGVAEDDAARVCHALPRACDRLVYGSSTGVYRPPEDPEEWIDEDWPAEPDSHRGEARLAYERGLADNACCPVHVVRIAGIYGPGRTLAAKVEAGELLLFEEAARYTSRIHRDDLSRQLAAMLLHPSPPPRLVACDDLPTSTAEVATFTAALIGAPPPESVDLETARARMSPLALEMRMGGKRCRSLHRVEIGCDLRFPSYREGVRQALEADGLLVSPPRSS